jgi:hypothetical protein
MNKPMLLAILAALASVASSVSAACKMQQIAAVNVEVADNGAVMVPVKVNGGEAWMILGMGSGAPVVWPAAAEVLGLKPQRQVDLDMRVRGEKVTHKVVADSLILGTAQYTKWDLYLDPDKNAPLRTYRGKPLLGGLTSRFMSVVDVELNLASNRMNLFKQTTGCKGQQVYWNAEVTAVDAYYDPSGLMVFPMEIDGKRVEASLYTQGGTSVISELVTSRFFGFDRDSNGITREAGSNGDEVASYRAMGLTAKGLAISNVPIRLQDDTSLKRDCEPTKADRNSGAIGFGACWGRAPLALGTGLLKKLRLYIAPRESKIYFTRAASTAPGPVPGRPGPDGASVPHSAGPGAPVPAAGDPAVQQPAAAPAASDAAANPAGAAADAAPTR